MPKRPVKLAGMRTDPPPSVPMDNVQRPAASAAAAPPLEPPGVRSVFHGLRQGSPSLFSVVPDWPNSGVLVLPKIIAPDCLTRSTTMESMSGTRCLKIVDPMVVTTPLVTSKSLMDIGTPCSGPNVEPFCIAASADWASTMAWSLQIVR